MNVKSITTAAMKPEMIARGNQSARSCSEARSGVIDHLPPASLLVYLAPELVRNRSGRAFEAFGGQGRGRGTAVERGRALVRLASPMRATLAGSAVAPGAPAPRLRHAPPSASRRERSGRAVAASRPARRPGRP